MCRIVIYLKSKHLRHFIVNSLLIPFIGSCSENNMPSTVNKRCVIYILAKRVRSQTVSLKCLWILLNKGYNMLNNTKNLRWYCNLWSLCMRMTQLTICRCRCFGGCNFWKEISSKSKIKRIFHGVMVRIGKVEPEGWPVRSGPSFSEVQITGLPEGSTFPILANDPVIDYFSCLSTLIDHLTP